MPKPHVECVMPNEKPVFRWASRILQGTSIVGLTLILCLAGPAWAQVTASTAPATTTAPSGTTVPSTSTAPSTQPATPRAAYRALVVAMEDGDTDAIRSLLQADTDLQRDLADAVAAYAAALAHLRRIAAEAYGPGNTRVLVGDRASQEEALAQIESANERIDGDHATLVEKGSEEPLATLRRVGDQWKVTLTGAVQGLSDADVRGRIDEMYLQIRLLNDIAGEIQDHRYQTAEEAAQVLRARLMRPASDATTVPVTRP